MLGVVTAGDIMLLSKKSSLQCQCNIKQFMGP